MSDQGFGIAGHKNFYSTKVKVGNWNEDTIALHLVKTRQVPPLRYETETRKNHIDYSHFPPDPRTSKLKIDSAEEIQARNKEGLSYEIVFSHGEIDAHERFRTTNQLSYFKSQFSVPDGTLRQSREKQLNGEMRDTMLMTTQSRNANRRVELSSSKQSKRPY